MRQVRKIVVDDVATEMRDVKADFAARRLVRMEKEGDEENECEASLEEALTNQSKAVTVVARKWFVDEGFGRAPTGEIVFIHASTVQGAEVLTMGSDPWVQVVNDARAQGRYRAGRAW